MAFRVSYRQNVEVYTEATFKDAPGPGRRENIDTTNLDNKPKAVRSCRGSAEAFLAQHAETLQRIEAQTKLALASQRAARDGAGLQATSEAAELDRAAVVRRAMSAEQDLADAHHRLYALQARVVCKAVARVRSSRSGVLARGFTMFRNAFCASLVDTRMRLQAQHQAHSRMEEALRRHLAISMLQGSIAQEQAAITRAWLTLKAQVGLEAAAGRAQDRATSQMAAVPLGLVVKLWSACSMIQRLLEAEAATRVHLAAARCGTAFLSVHLGMHAAALGILQALQSWRHWWQQSKKDATAANHKIHTVRSKLGRAIESAVNSPSFARFGRSHLVSHAE